MPTFNVAIDGRKAVSEARNIKGAVGQARDEFGRFAKSVDSTDSSLKRVGESTKRIRQQIRRFRSAGGFGALFAGGAAAVGAVRTLGSFEESLARVRAIAIDGDAPLAAQDARMRELTTTVRELGATTSFTADQAARGALELTRAGFSMNETIAALPSTLNLALNAEIELARATEITANTIRQFNLAATDAEKVTDVLANTAASSTTNISDIAEAMKLAGPIAASLGIDVETTAAAIGVMADNGLKGSLAGTNLRGVLVSLIDPTKAGAAVMNELSDAERVQAGVLRGDLLPVIQQLADGQIDAAEALALFQRRQATGGLILSENIEKLKELTEANRNAEGANARVAEQVGATLPKRFAELKSALDEVVLGTGDQGLTGALKESTDFLTLGLRSYGRFSDELTGVEKAAQFTTTAIGAAGLAGGLLTVARLVSPAGLLIGGLTAGASLLVQWARESDEAARATRDFRRETQALGQQISDLEIERRLAIDRGDIDDNLRALRGQVAALKEAAVSVSRARAEGLSTSFQDLDPEGVIFTDEFIREEAARIVQTLERDLNAALSAVQIGRESTLQPFDEVVKVDERIAQRQAEIDKIKALVLEVENIGDAGRNLVGARSEAVSAELERRIEQLDTSADFLAKERDRLVEEAEKEKTRRFQEVRGVGDVPGLGAQGGATDSFVDGLKRSFEGMRDFRKAQREALGGLFDFQRALQEDIRLSKLSADEREKELAVIEARNDLARVGIELVESEANKIRALVAARQKSEETASAQLDADRRREAEGEQARSIRRAIDRQIGRDFAGAIVGPIRQGLEDEEFKIRDVAANIGIAISEAATEAFLLRPIEGLLERGLTKISSELGLADIEFTASAGIAGKTFAAEVIAAAEIVATTWKLAGLGGGGGGTGPAALGPFGGLSGFFNAIGNIVPSAQSGGTQNAAGDVFSSLGIPDIISRPTMFRGPAGTTNTAGEGGEEVVMPVVRSGKTNRLAVEAVPGGASPTNVTFNTTMVLQDEGSLRRTRRQMAQDDRIAQMKAR